MNTSDTKQTIMDAARATVQARGYNALSFRELAKEVGIKSASVHYHFPTKGDLGAALARRYTEDAVYYLDGLLASHPDPHACLKEYPKVFRAALADDNRMCLCGIMAAERHDLPLAVRTEVDKFTEVNVGWLTKVLALQKPKARKKEVLEQRATAIFAAIEGAQLLARGRGDIALFDQSIAAYREAGLIP